MSESPRTEALQLRRRLSTANHYIEDVAGPEIEALQQANDKLRREKTEARTANRALRAQNERLQEELDRIRQERGKESESVADQPTSQGYNRRLSDLAAQVGSAEDAIVSQVASGNAAVDQVHGTILELLAQSRSTEARLYVLEQRAAEKDSALETWTSEVVAHLEALSEGLHLAPTASHAGGEGSPGSGAAHRTPSSTARPQRTVAEEMVAQENVRIRRNYVILGDAFKQMSFKLAHLPPPGRRAV